MFPSIPTREALSVIEEALEENIERLREVSFLSPAQVVSFLRLSIDNTYAVVQDGEQERWFQQIKGLAMGKSFSPQVADLYMGRWEEDLQERAIQCGGDVRLAMRYADDFLVAFQGEREHLLAWVESLNSKHPSIRVTLEEEVGGQISFLDLNIKRSQQGFITSVYRKACNTGQVVPYGSFTERRYLESGIRADTIRAVRYCSNTKDLRKEFDHIRSTYLRQGFPAFFVHKVVQKTQASLRLKKRALPAPPSKETELFISVPFTGGSFYALQRAAREIGVRLVSKPSNTIGSSLCSHAKHHLPKMQESDVVYSIRCDCGARYIGETSQELQDRLSGHRRSWEAGDGLSAFSGHQNHQPDFDGSQVLGREKHSRLRLLLESAFIRSYGQRETVLVSPNDANINRNSGTMLSDRWLPIILSASTGQIPASQQDSQEGV